MKKRNQFLPLILILLAVCILSFLSCKGEEDSSSVESDSSYVSSLTTALESEQTSQGTISDEESSILEEESSSKTESSITDSSSPKQESSESSFIEESSESSFIEESSRSEESASEGQSSIDEESSREEETSSIEESSSEEVSSSDGVSSSEGKDSSLESSSCEHSWKEESRVQYCDKEGKIIRTCRLCGEAQEDVLPACGHKSVPIEAVPATCKEYGKTAGSQCERCKEVLVEPELIDKLDHEYVENCCKSCGTVALNFVYKDNGYYCKGTPAKDAHSVIIPDEYMGERVVGIASGAFSGMHGLNSLTVGKNIEVIEEGAFADCCNLVEVYDFSLAQIAKENIDLSNYVLDYYTSAQETSKLHKDENGYITYADGEDQVLFLGYDGIEPKDHVLNIPEGVTIINPYSVSTAKWAKYVVLSDTVTYIRKFAFYACFKLEELTIGENVEKIDIYLCDAYSALKRVIFKNPDDWMVRAAEGSNQWFSLGDSVNQPEVIAEWFKAKENGPYWQIYWKKSWVTLFP